MSASDLGGENFAIIKGNNVDGALDFLKFATDPVQIKTYINEFGYIASRKDVAATQFTNDPIMQVFADQMASAQPRGPHPRWPEISDALSLAMNESIVGLATPEAAAAKAQTKIDSILK
jgi:multiple sugar transport system substrate-binding protein